MKKISILLVLALIAALFAGCQLTCKHEWAEATCEAPKTCENCGKTEGEELDHSWAEATCDAPKTCKECGKTMGDALGHSWAEATTEAPKTCTVCRATEGEPLARYQNEDSKELYGKWTSEMIYSGREMGLDDFDTVLVTVVHMEFTEDGRYSVRMEAPNWDSFRKDLIAYTIDDLLVPYEEAGLTIEDADADMMALYGITVEEFAEMLIGSLDFDALVEECALDGVYYAEGGLIYLAENWDGEFETEDYNLEDGVLTIDALTDFDNVTVLEWTRAEK